MLWAFNSSIAAITRGWSYKDIHLHHSSFLVFSHTCSQYFLRAWFHSSEKLRSNVSTSGNSNLLLDTNAFCSKTSCRKLPIHSPWLTQLSHLLKRGELIRTSSLSWDFKYSLFVSRAGTLQDILLLLHVVQQLLSWPAHRRLHQGPRTEHEEILLRAKSRESLVTNDNEDFYVSLWNNIVAEEMKRKINM